MSKVILDEELEEGLRQAKTKPRNFAIIAKGVKIKKLIVRKKPIREGELLTAKSEFKGDEIIRGVCLGDGGQNIAFQVLEAQKIRPVTFREFINEQTGLTLKPEFAVVPEIKEVDDDGPEDPTKAPPKSTARMEPPTRKPPPIPSSEPPTTSPKSIAPEVSGESVESVLSDLMERMNKLVPMVKTAVQAKPERRDDFTEPVASFKKHVQDKNVDGAKKSLLAIGTLVKEVMTGSVQPQTGEPQPQVSPPQPQSGGPSVSGDDKGEARKGKRDELEVKVKSYKNSVQFYERSFGERADPKHRQDMDKWLLDVANADKLVDHDAAIRAYDGLILSSSTASRMLMDLHKRDQDRQKGGQAITALEGLNTAPEYGGKNPLKSTGKKEFERDVTRPVAALMAAIKGPVGQGLPIPETNHTELVRLKGVLEKKKDEFDAKAEGVNKDKHPHTRKLYEDYASTCEKLLEKLKEVETAGVDVLLGKYREKKREVEAALAQLDKTIALWKRLDEETHKLQLTVAGEKRKAFQAVVDQHSRDNNSDAGLSAMTELLADLKKTIKGVFASKESNDQLDKAVGKIGREAKSSADKEFVTEALKARYDLDRFEGDLTGTSLVALYKVFGMVPDSHTKKNKWLTDLERKSSLSDVESFYFAKDKEEAEKPAGLVTIKAMRSTGFLAAVQNNLMGPLLLKNVEGNKKVDQFSWVTLHEIGHAVDHADDFMSKRKQDFGDWQEHTKEEIDALMLKELAASHPKLSKRFLKTYLTIAKSGKDPAVNPELLGLWKSQAGVAASGVTEKELLDDPGVAEAENLRLKGAFTDDESNAVKFKVKLTGTKRAVASEVLQGILRDKRPAADVIKEIVEGAGENKDPNQVPDWKTLAASDIFVWYKSAVLKEPPGIFAGIKQMTGAANWIRAAEKPVGGRIYHESYKGDWVSYDPVIRNTRVTDYQLRAPGEYFAEAYAAYMLGKLPNSAPLYKDMEILEAKEELAN